MVDRHSGHGPSGDAKEHPSLRKLEQGAVDLAKRLFGEGKAPKEVLEDLRSWNEAITAQDVYNLKAKIAREAGETGDGTPSASGAAAAATPGTTPTARRGNKRKRTSTVAGAEDGITVDDDTLASTVLDPALHGQGIGIGGRAPAARMQASDTNGGAGGINGEAGRQKGKCQCKCCDH